MARVGKVDNSVKKRHARTEKKRPIDIREKKVYFLVVCEGEKTEPNYFVAFGNQLPIGTVEIRIDGTGLNTLGLINYTINQKKCSLRKFDRVWAVFDKDNFDKNFNNAILKAKANDISCAWTNEAFELWFLLHFQFVNHAMNRDSYKEFLEREIRQKSGDLSYQYLKNDTKTYYLINKFGNLLHAIECSKKLVGLYNNEKYSSHNPCTRVHELILELQNPQEILDK